MNRGMAAWAVVVGCGALGAACTSGERSDEDEPDYYEEPCVTTQCWEANATGYRDCVLDHCVLQSCNPGFGDCNGSISDGCEIDLTANPEHCGLCGNVCSEGACHQGSCREPEAVWAPPTELNRAVVSIDGGEAYVATQQAQILRFALPAGPSTGLGAHDERCSSLAGAGDVVFAAEYDVVDPTAEEPVSHREHAMARITLAGRTELGRSRPPRVGPVVLGAHAYWVEKGTFVDSVGDLAQGTTVLMRAPADVGEPTVVREWAAPRTLSQLLVAGDTLVWDEHDLALVGGSLAPSNERVVAYDPASGLEQTHSISSGKLATDGAYLYSLRTARGYLDWPNLIGSAPATHFLEALELGGTEAAHLAWEGDANVIGPGLAAVDGRVFWVDRLYTGSQIHGEDIEVLTEVDTRSGVAERVARVPITPLAVHDRFVYWLEPGGLSRLAVPE